MVTEKICAFVAVAGLAMTGFAAELDLAGEWTLSGSNELGQAISCPIAVPGDVQSALFAAERMPDPFWVANETNIQWVGQREWTLTRDFTVDASLLQEKSVILRLEDVDTYCTVFVNGKKAGFADNRFRRWDFDVKPFLREGRNVITGVFENAEARIEKRRGEYDVDWQWPTWMNGRVLGICLIRKPQCHAGWDWGLSQMTIGFCGPVKLIASDWRIDYVYTAQRFNADLSHCDLDIIAEISDADGSRSVVTNTMAIKNPRLWWPNGQGEQFLTPWSVKVRGRTVSGRTGLRTIEFVTKQDRNPETGGRARSCYFKVNGRPVFMKGANWIPCDAFDSRQTTDRYRDLLESARNANMNMIRLWGGGQFEKDAFYELCDELGLLIWHDFMFACSNYPDDDAFFASVRAEVAHQVKRLRNHASIALWCGDNECINAVRNACGEDGDQELYVTAYARRRLMLKRLVAELDPTRRFWPSSPCREEGDFERRSDIQHGLGDEHYWGVWHGNRDFESFYNVRTRFCSEFGFQSFPSPELAKTFSASDPLDWQSPDFLYHQKNKRGNAIITNTFSRYFHIPKDTKGVLYLSQVQQALAIKTGVEYWRSLRPWCMGTLYWQLNDNWPVASWSSIEYGGKWKQLHYQARRFYEPLYVVGLPGCRIAALNDLPQSVDAEISVEAWAFDGVSPTKTVRIRKTLAAGGVHMLLPKDFGVEGFGDTNGFFVLTMKTDRGMVQNEWIPRRFKDCPLAAANIETKFDGLKVTLTTDRPAFYVWANVENIRGEFSDNSFTLLPGRSVTLEFIPKGPHPTPCEFRKCFSVMDLSDINPPNEL